MGEAKIQDDDYVWLLWEREAGDRNFLQSWAADTKGKTIARVADLLHRNLSDIKVTRVRDDREYVVCIFDDGSPSSAIGGSVPRFLIDFVAKDEFQGGDLDYQSDESGAHKGLYSTQDHGEYVARLALAR